MNGWHREGAVFEVKIGWWRAVSHRDSSASTPAAVEKQPIRVRKSEFDLVNLPNISG